MINFTYKQIVNKTIKLVQKLNKTKKLEERKIMASIILKYKLHPNFFHKLFSQKNYKLLAYVFRYIMRHNDIVKTLNYYYDNMAGGYNQVKYLAILEFIAIAYHSVAPTIPQYPKLYRIKKRKY